MRYKNQIYSLVLAPVIVDLAPQNFYISDSSKITSPKVIKEYDVFKDKEKKAKAGTLNLIQDQAGVKIKFNDKEFSPNIYSGYCRGMDSYLYYHQAKSIHGTLVNLGKGPWGPDAWIEALFKELYKDTSIKFAFRGTNNWIHFQKVDNKIIGIGTQVYEKDGELESKDVRFENISESELFDENGMLKVKINCSFS